jgi:hypothetical protein
MGIVDYQEFIQTHVSINPAIRVAGGALVDGAARLVTDEQFLALKLCERSPRQPVIATTKPSP